MFEIQLHPPFLHSDNSDNGFFAQAGDYQELVRHAFTGPGRGFPAVLRRHLSEHLVRAWMIERGRGARTLPRDLKADDWATLFRLRR